VALWWFSKRTFACVFALSQEKIPARAKLSVSVFILALASCYQGNIYQAYSRDFWRYLQLIIF
jgi:hypothetical protein